MILVLFVFFYFAITKGFESLLGGVAQFGIFATLVGVLALSQYLYEFDFSLRDTT